MTGSERESSSHPESEQSLTQSFNFQVGDKRLSLTVHKDTSRAFTTIRKTGDPYQPGATTQVYELARDTLERLASDLPAGLMYEFHTENSKLSAWAKDAEKGERIFAWDEIVDIADGVFALKFFPPKES